ncbi:MAG: AEC family transporter [Afipia sp.]|nr:AEC family transporter [Afipia sp.]
MLPIVAAIVPTFLLIVAGFVLRRLLVKEEAHWLGTEQLVYYVLFPALLFRTLSRAKLADVPLFGVGGALLIAVLLMAALCLALRPVLMRRLNLSGPSFTSVFQCACRWQTYVALAVAGSLYGDIGLTLASVAMVAMIPVLNIMAVWVLAHYASPTRLSWPRILLTIAQNPFIWACVIGLIANLTGLVFPKWLDDFIDALGRSSLALGLLVVGAGLQLKGVLRPEAPAILACALKLLVMPAMAISLGLAFGLSGANLAIVACCSSVPTASSAYVLARQMGGNAPLVAEILTLQTIIAVITMPIVIALVA